VRVLDGSNGWGLFQPAYGARLAPGGSRGGEAVTDENSLGEARSRAAAGLRGAGSTRVPPSAANDSSGALATTPGARLLFSNQEAVATGAAGAGAAPGIPGSSGPQGAAATAPLTRQPVADNVDQRAGAGTRGEAREAAPAPGGDSRQTRPAEPCAGAVTIGASLTQGGGAPTSRSAGQGDGGTATGLAGRSVPAPAARPAGLSRDAAFLSSHGREYQALGQTREAVPLIPRALFSVIPAYHFPTWCTCTSAGPRPI
jgi:hypothetical protein